jgi:GTP-binding protein
MSATIAIVGRPNVGKSRLFNALLGRKVAIVHDQPGVTRDANIAELTDGLDLVDTGGWGLSKTRGIENENLAQAVENQVAIATEQASAILFVVDGRNGLTALDSQIAQWLRPHHDLVTVVINKIDAEETPFDEGEISRLGFSRTWIVSAEHNRGIATLKSRLLPLARPEPKPEATESRPAVCIIGRPNVGKSSLINALVHSSRMIVSPVSGTTRDPVEDKRVKGLQLQKLRAPF